MVIRLYHGSEHIIEQPEYGRGKRYNDYGQGFYCTKNIELAKEWGVDDMHDGYANAYGFLTDGMKVLNLNSKDYCILHWMSVLIENREFDAPSEVYPMSRTVRVLNSLYSGQLGLRIPCSWTTGILSSYLLDRCFSSDTLLINVTFYYPVPRVV